MINICKEEAPRSFTRWKENQKNVEGLDLNNYEGDYSDLLPSDVKHDLQISLCSEQGNVCCYCMAKITTKSMRVEHWKDQHAHKEGKFDYDNMLGACCGGEGSEFHHCDVSKGNKSLSFNPSVDRIEETISYNFKTGEILSANNSYDADMNTVLHLNGGYLPENRLSALKQIILRLKQRGFSRNNLQKEIDRCSSANKPAYAGILLQKMQKKLASQPA